ncbi:MAG: hypothetical protein JST82_00780 [Bacteroidetes bacterium]|nr:hypothetical protein [Bacteroidota bacterium]
MLRIIRLSCLVILVLFAHKVSAQEGMYETSQIPMDSLISIKLTGRDTASLEFYTLYNFQYNHGGTMLDAEFLQPKKYDEYKGQKTAKVKLCKVTHFVNTWHGIDGLPVPVEGFIEVLKSNGKGKIFLNLDPEMPDPVYIPCESQKKMLEKK